MITLHKNTIFGYHTITSTVDIDTKNFEREYGYKLRLSPIGKDFMYTVTCNENEARMIASTLAFDYGLQLVIE